MIWGYIVLAYLSLFALGISDNSRGPLFPEILKTFAVSDSQGALFFALSSFCGFLASYLVRFLLCHWSRTRIMQWSLILMGGSLLGMGFAKSFFGLVLCSSFFGASLGLVGVVQNILVSVGSAPQRRQQMLSGLHATYGIASFLAPLLVAGVSLWGGTWRVVFFTVAAVPLVIFLGFLGWREKQTLSATDLRRQLTPPLPQSRKEHIGQIFLALSLGFYVLVEAMVATRLPLLMRRQKGMGLEESSYYLTAFFLCMLVGRLLFTVFRFKWPLRHMLSCFLLLSALSLGIGLTGVPAFLSLSGLFMAPFYPLAIVYVSSHYEKTMDSAISYCIALQSIFTVAMHALVGYLTEVYGISLALWTGPFGLVVSFLLLNSFERLFKKAS